MVRPVFAAIAHQQDWRSIAAMVNGMRQQERPGASMISERETAEIIDFLPPRVTSRFRAGGVNGTAPLEGIYIETFIRPDELSGRPGRAVLEKVERAIAVAQREGAKIVALGGFTSILVEAGARVPEGAPALTSGNTLTVAIILRTAESGLALLGRSLAEEHVLVIGASGDIGTGVSRWLAGRCHRLTLSARSRPRLERLQQELGGQQDLTITLDPASALAEATLVIAAASTADQQFTLERCRPGTLLCDAGYPKNLAERGRSDLHLFHGGIGRIAGSIHSHDGLLERFYTFPIPDVVHGCMLEGIVLGLANRFEPYSQGRGHITAKRIDEMWALAETHGAMAAPLFNAQGLWPQERVLA